MKLADLVSPEVEKLDQNLGRIQREPSGESAFAEEKRSEEQAEEEKREREQSRVQESMRAFVEQVQQRQSLFRGIGPD